MSDQNIDRLVRSMLEYIEALPLPDSYGAILREQISCSSIRVEEYYDCIKMLFENHGSAKKFPPGLPTLLQGGQVLKSSGPISFQLFLEKGYVVQFEVVDMGLDKIDWDFFRSHIPIYDVEYS